MNGIAERHHIQELPIVVLSPHSRCNCRCLMCDIWKLRQVREITVKDIEPHLADLRRLKTRWVVLTGGEPLLHSHLPLLCRSLRREGVRITLLTAGLNLEQQASSINGLVDDIIVSIDGPQPVHDDVRGIPGAFGRLVRGLWKLRDLEQPIPVSGRCTVQKRNFGHLRETVAAARELGLQSLSFLAADVASAAFNRGVALSVDRRNLIAPSLEELDQLDVLERELKSLISECAGDIASGFIRETPEKLRRISLHFRACAGMAEPVAPRCNAPWVSTVVEADGTVRPCFFQPPLGNLQDATLDGILNAEASVRFRERLDVATNPICKTCVCSLYLPTPSSAEAS